MSYGKEFEINDETYLVERNSQLHYDYYSVSKKNSDTEYKELCEGTAEEILSSFELKGYDQADYDTQMFGILIYVLESRKIVNPYKDYKTYIYKMCEQHSREEILSSDSDEYLIYKSNYPLRDEAYFKWITSSHITDFENEK